MSVRLGGVDGDAQAQLDGFKSRALRLKPAVEQRHLYATSWRSMDLVSLSAVSPDRLLVLSECASEQQLDEAAWSAVMLAVAVKHGQRAHEAMLGLYAALGSTAALA